MIRCESMLQLKNCSSVSFAFSTNQSFADESHSWFRADTDVSDRLLHLISIIYMSMVLVVGLAGNTIASFIFFFSPLWRRNPTTKYLMALAIADNLVIVSLGLPLLQAAHFSIPYFPYMCHINIFAFYFGIALTSYYCRNSINF